MIGKCRKFKLINILLLLAFILPIFMTSPAYAVASYPFNSTSTEVSSAVDYLRGQQDATGMISDFSTSAWAVMAIVAAGENPNDWKVGTNPSIMDYLSANAATATSATDYARMILAITAASGDPRNFGGLDFVSMLSAQYDGTQLGNASLLNDDYWGLMALISAGVLPADAMIQNVTANILSNQNTDGGWGWAAGTSSDVDDTAAAIMALMAAEQSASSTAIINALNYLKSQQVANGGFDSWGQTNSATDSWAIGAINSAGQDPSGILWKSTSNFDPLDDLLTFQNVDGSFNWTASVPSNKVSMTASAIPALMGIAYPVAGTTSGSGGVTVDVRIEGQAGTIWDGTVTVTESTITDDTGGQHVLNNPTALGALDEASKAGGFPYVVKNSSYGLYLYSINGEDPEGMAGWMYRVDYYSPMFGVADFVLGQSTPPTPPHYELLFAYSEYGQLPLKLEVSNAIPGVGESFTVTVTEYNDSTNTWSPSEGASVHADQDYTTDVNGTVSITVASDATLNVYADKTNYIRSNAVEVVVGTGSTQSGVNHQITMTTAYDSVWQTHKEYKINMRQAAYVRAIERVVEAMKLRGWV